MTRIDRFFAAMVISGALIWAFFTDMSRVPFATISILAIWIVGRFVALKKQDEQD